MASITVRNLDENVKKRLRKQAAEHGRSLEAEVREILSRNATHQLLPRPKTGLDLVQPLIDFAKKYGGVELEIPERTPMRPLPDFGEDAKAFRRKK
jgi:plasmid stability protein